MKRTCMSEAECPVVRSLDVIGDWWSLLIVRDAFDGARRFSEFQKRLGIAKQMLTTRLRDLVDQGVFASAPAADGSSYREYLLTKKGRGLFLVVVALRQWGEEYLYAPDEAHSRLIEQATGEPVARLELRSRADQPLGWRDTVVQKERG